MTDKTFINVRVERDKVWLNLNDRATGRIDWRGAREIAEDLKALSRSGCLTVFYKFALDGHTAYLDLEPRIAASVARAIYQVSLLAEEFAKAESIARDSAILIRAGAPFTLSNHPKIMDLAAQVAAWDSELRRYMPGIKSSEVVGCPTLKQDPPPIKEAA